MRKIVATPPGICNGRRFALGRSRAAAAMGRTLAERHVELCAVSASLSSPRRGRDWGLKPRTPSLHAVDLLLRISLFSASASVLTMVSSFASWTSSLPDRSLKTA